MTIKLDSTLSGYSGAFHRFWRNLMRWTGLESSDFTNLANFSDLNDFTFVTNDFGYITYFLVEGNSVPASPQLDEKIKDLYRAHLGDYVKRGHQIIDTYCFYNDTVEDTVRETLASRSHTASRLGLDVTNKDSAMSSMLGKLGFFESRVVAVYTPDQSNLINESLADLSEELPHIPLSLDARNSISLGRGDKLMQSHLSFVSAYEQLLTDENSHYVGKRMSCNEALLEIAKVSDPKNAAAYSSIDPENISVSVTNATNNLGESQYDALFGKDFTDFIHPQMPEKFARDIIKVGDRLYMMVVVESHPREPLSYVSLQKSIAKHSFPYRVKMVTGGSAVDHFAAGYHAAGAQINKNMGGFGQDGQNQFRKAFDTIDYYNASQCVTLTQQVFTTWVDGAENEAVLRRNASLLKDSIATWTKSEQIKCRIDHVTPFESFFSTLPSYRNSTAPKIPCPFIDTLSRMPFIRPCLPKKSGGEIPVIYPDGKLDMLDFSPLAAQIRFICGAPGRGKSVFTMRKRDSCIFAKGNTQLPFEFNIEVGASTKASLDSLQAQNPDLADKIAFYNIQNRSAESGKEGLRINILSTPLGMRQPLPHILDAIATLIGDRIKGEDGKEQPRADELIKDALLKTYKANSARISAKTIQLSRVPGLETALRETGFVRDDDIVDETGMKRRQTYVAWDIVDHLIAHDRDRLASKVQSLAEPTMLDLKAVANTEDFMVKWAEQKYGSDVATSFVRSVDAFITNYPFVSGASTTNIYSKHIVTFELGSVISKSGAASDLYKNRFWFGLAMLFSRSVIFMSEQDHSEEVEYIVNLDGENRPSETPQQRSISKEFTKKILQKCLQRLRLISSSIKEIHVDEMQAFLPSKGGVALNYAGAVLSSLVFEARKFQIAATFSSQRPEHGELFNQTATCFIILGFPGDEDADACAEMFGVPASEVNRVIKKLKLDPSRGINAFVVLKEVERYSSSIFRQEVYVPVPGYEIWEYANSGIERHIRTAMQNEFTYSDALLLLTGALPFAGKSQELARAEMEARENGSLDDVDDQSQQEAIIADKICAKLKANAPMYIEFGRRTVAGDIGLQAA